MYCFEKFISLFELNPFNYVFVTSLAWDVSLLKSKIEFKLIVDEDMYLLFQKILEDTFLYLESYFKTINEFRRGLIRKFKDKYVVISLFFTSLVSPFIQY